MASTLRTVLWAIALPLPLVAAPRVAQEDRPDAAPDPAPEQESNAGEWVREALAARRAADFPELLTGARLVGYFSDNANPDAAPQADSYTLQRVSKAEGDAFLFEAAIEFGERSIPIGLELPVLWAGDTPVITVTDVGFPMLGTYSARVLFHGERYAGTWSGDEQGGSMWGRVVRQESGATPSPSPTPMPVPEPKPHEESQVEAEGVHWPSFRGPGASGVGLSSEIPTEWDVESGENVRWRVPVPGLAHSSPVIWGDRIFLTTAVRVGGEQELKVGLYGDISSIVDGSEFRFEVHCFDKHTGESLWSRVAWVGVPDVMRHAKGSHAASSPAVDDKRVVAFFGSEGLYAFDLDGEPLWKRDLGPMDSGYYVVPDAQWGFASSPVLHEGRVLLQCDVQEGSFVAALDASTGETLWRTAREDVPTWSTPTVLVREGRSQVILNGYRHAGGYDLTTGEPLWKLVGGGDIPVPTPIVANDLVFLTSAHGPNAPILAVDVDATGELTMKAEDSPFLVWAKSRRGNYMQTPLAYGGDVYFCSDAGIMACYDVATGEERFRERLGAGRTGFSSSPVAANGVLYYASEEGEVYAVSMGVFEVLSVNSLGEECMATPAISEDALYYRTRGHLTAIGY